MPTSVEQNLSNHTRLDPLYHFVALPGTGILLLIAIAQLWRHGLHLVGLWMLLASVVLALLALKARTFPLKAQDRLIRLEERLRLRELMDANQHPLIDRLTEGQLIALRFASDGEAAQLAANAANQGMTPVAIKKAIVSWRADYFRV